MKHNTRWLAQAQVVQGQLLLRISSANNDPQSCITIGNPIAKGCRKVQESEALTLERNTGASTEAAGNCQSAIFLFAIALRFMVDMVKAVASDSFIQVDTSAGQEQIKCIPRI